MVATLHRRLEGLTKKRSNWESHWQELADFMLPRKADIVKVREPGDKRTELIFDGTAIHAVELLASSLHGMLTSPSTPWFSLRFRDPELQNNDEANEWLENSLAQMYQHFNRSNFQQEIHELYYDLVVFGTAAIYVDLNDEMLRFNSRHIAEIYISENSQGQVDTVYRKFQMTVRAMEQQFGRENLPQDVIKDLDENPYAEHDLVHAVFPRGETKGRVGKLKAIGSIYYHADKKKTFIK